MILQHFTQLYALTVFCHCPLVSSQPSKAGRQAVSLSVTSSSSSSQVVSRSVNRSLSVSLSICPCQSLYHSFTHSTCSLTRFMLLQIFTGNSDRFTLEAHWLKYPITTGFLRFRPKSWTSTHVCMKIRVYGCNV